ncbi:19852_t:CDS:2, partial [Gigaspora margarita]
QKELPEDLKETKKEPENNDSNNVKKEPVRKYKNISKKFSKLYKWPRVKTSEIEQKNQETLSEDSKEAENKLEDNASISSIAF